MHRMKCPTTPRFEGDLVGCGSTQLDGPDEEGFYDCLECGLFFTKEASDEPNTPATERTETPEA
jgi:hypothetical protein